MNCPYYREKTEILRSECLSGSRIPLPPQVNTFMACHHPRRRRAIGSTANPECQGYQEQCLVDEHLRGF